jgi:hypothetical protein
LGVLKFSGVDVEALTLLFFGDFLHKTSSRDFLHKISRTMVEKAEAVANGEETVLVEAIRDLSRDHGFGKHTVGAAIEVFEEVASNLFSIQVFGPANGKKNEEGKEVKKFSVPGSLLRLPSMIDFGITVAIDQNKNATHDSIGTRSNASALVEGNIVALYYEPHQWFVRMHGEAVDFGDRAKGKGKLPFDWDSERFLVVSAGNGRIALYSPSHRRFLACTNGEAETSHPVENLDDRPRHSESFRIVASNSEPSSNTIQLCCEIDDNRMMYVDGQGPIHFQVVQIHGFEPAK